MTDFVEIDGGASAPQGAASPAESSAIAESPAYAGRIGELIPIVLGNMALSLLTLGIYRFWGKTKIRRYLWSRTAFQGQPLEYTGTGTELFLGFLIVMVILIPVLVLNSILQISLQKYPTALLVSQAIYVLGFLYLIYIATYRAQRYRLSRTTWRGIRGGMTGSSVSFANKAFLYILLNIVTLGILYPKMQVALQKYRTENSAFGDVNFGFDASHRPLMKPWLVSWAILAAIYAVIGYFAYEFFSTYQGTPTQEQMIEIFVGAFMILIALGIFAGLALIWYNIVVLRLFVAGTRFEDLSAISSITAGRLIMVYLPAYLVYGGLLLLFIVGAALGATSNYGAGGLTALLIIPLVVVGMFLPIILINRLIAALCATMVITGAFSPERLLQNQLDKPTTGEGLAEALEVDAL
ncbi:MAG: DUF898 family protein [Proteobacteria bacterium]|nr:DUF898 family protein [Pseudomonadota bacterium]